MAARPVVVDPRWNFANMRRHLYWQEVPAT
jgi:hypothetical protein